MSGIDEQVERIAKHHLIPKRRRLTDLECFDYTLCGKRNESWSLNCAVSKLKRPSTGVVLGIAGVNRKVGHSDARA